MSMVIHRMGAPEWRVLAERAHFVCFGKRLKPGWGRVDFALVGMGADAPVGFITCREENSETVYLEFGGAFPETKGTAAVWRCYQQGIEYLLERYPRLTTSIENKNTAMLKLAMKVGFRIVGVRNFRGKVMLEHDLSMERTA